MLFKKIILPLTAALAISTASYANDDATILNFESNNLNENAITLKSEIPNLLSHRLDNVFDIFESSKFNKGIEQIRIDEPNLDKIKEDFPGLDYLILGNFNIIGEKNISINSKLIDLTKYKIYSQHTEGSVDNIFQLMDNIAEEIKSDIEYKTESKEQQPKIEEETKPVIEKTIEEETSGYFYTVLRKPKTDRDEIKEKISKEDATKENYPRTIGLIAKLTFPYDNENFEKFYNNAPSIGFEILSRVNNFSIGVPIIGYRVFNPDYDKQIEAMDLSYSDFEILEGGAISILNIGGDLTYYSSPDKEVIPSIGVGAGYYKAKAKEVYLTRNGRKEEISESSSDGGLGINFEAGLEKRLNDKFSVKFFAGYERVFFEEDLEFIYLGAKGFYWK